MNQTQQNSQLEKTSALTDSQSQATAINKYEEKSMEIPEEKHEGTPSQYPVPYIPHYPNYPVLQPSYESQQPGSQFPIHPHSYPYQGYPHAPHPTFHGPHQPYSPYQYQQPHYCGHPYMPSFDPLLKPKRTQQKRGFSRDGIEKSWIFLGSGILVLLLGLLLWLGSDGDHQEEYPNEHRIEQEAVENEESEGTVLEKSKENVGQSPLDIILGDSKTENTEVKDGYGLREVVNLNGIEMDLIETRVLPSSGQDMAEHGQFLLIDLSLTNVSKEAKEFDLRELTLEDGEGNIYYPTNHSESTFAASGEMAPNVGMEFTFAFDVPFSNLYMLIYNGSLGEAKWTILPENISS